MAILRSKRRHSRATATYILSGRALWSIACVQLSVDGNASAPAEQAPVSGGRRRVGRPDAALLPRSSPQLGVGGGGGVRRHCCPSAVGCRKLDSGRAWCPPGRGLVFCSSRSSLTWRSQFERIYVLNLPGRTDRRDGLVLMSALAGFKVHWIDGVLGEAVPDKALPYPASHESVKSANIGSWRAHLNALQACVPYPLASLAVCRSLFVCRSTAC